MADLRTKIAWLLWCANEGYLTEADRAGVSNIFTADPATLHPDDAFSLPKWLGMADALIRELKLREETWITTRSQPSTATSPNGRQPMTDTLRTRIAAVLYERFATAMSFADAEWENVEQEWLEDADAVIRELTEAIPPIVATAIQGYVQAELAAISHHGDAGEYEALKRLNSEALQIARYATTHIGLEWLTPSAPVSQPRSTTLVTTTPESCWCDPTAPVRRRYYRAAIRNFKREMRRARRQQPPLWRPRPWWRIW